MFRQFKTLALASALLSGASMADAANLNVTYAGSMGVVMDKALGPAFAKANDVTYQGQGRGAYAMAKLIASKQVPADVFVSITPGPMDVLKKAGLIDTAVPVASTSMVIAYNPKGKYGEAFKAAAANTAGAEPWWKILETPELKFGRTDPIGDPQGQNIIFTMLLAEKYYKQPKLEETALGEVLNTKQVFMEGNMLARLEAGQIDASSGYKSAVISAKLPYVELPDEINLSNPQDSAKWYDTVSFDVKGADGKQQTLKPEPLVFYAAVLKNAPNPETAKKFVDFMNSAEGQKLFADNGYDQPKGDGLYH
ncbi:extracellular solute-binding protein [Neorhizobium sp. NCHU2750]|uniref:extracellular solute-binding protein n=1 Tax=Neorhizobium sp. NCHU2750 TaxID=1825976 RepID=UPI000EB6DF2E|nr:ABC transporter substrate-binding protein [Neorhizobium sp. NCHU2750]